MSRLIDADKLIEDVLKSMPTGSARGVFRAFIEQQPTAYDVDKVVEQLKKQVYEIDDSLSLSARDVIDEEDVFEIVKAGGINNVHK